MHVGTGPDGVTRGAFSYLDDKGVQRTTQYIAGAGIGYRIVQDTTGPQTHLLPRPAVVEFGILYPRGGTGGVGNRGDGSATPSSGDDFDSDRNNGIPGDDDSVSIGGNTGTGVGNNIPGGSSGGNGGSGGSGGIDDGNNSIDGFGEPGPNRDDFDDNRNNGNGGGDRNDGDFPKRDRGIGTVITNSGDTYFGIAPGASARAHVQNIDLKPWGEEAISPGEALRRDERRSQRLRFRG